MAQSFASKILPTFNGESAPLFFLTFNKLVSFFLYLVLPNKKMETKKKKKSRLPNPGSACFLWVNSSYVSAKLCNHSSYNTDKKDRLRERIFFSLLPICLFVCWGDVTRFFKVLTWLTLSLFRPIHLCPSHTRTSTHADPEETLPSSDAYCCLFPVLAFPVSFSLVFRANNWR